MIARSGAFSSELKSSWDSKRWSRFIGEELVMNLEEIGQIKKLAVQIYEMHSISYLDFMDTNFVIQIEFFDDWRSVLMTACATNCVAANRDRILHNFGTVAAIKVYWSKLTNSIWIEICGPKFRHLRFFSEDRATTVRDRSRRCVNRSEAWTLNLQTRAPYSRSSTVCIVWPVCHIDELSCALIGTYPAST